MFSCKFCEDWRFLIESCRHTSLFPLKSPYFVVQNNHVPSYFCSAMHGKYRDRVKFNCGQIWVTRRTSIIQGCHIFILWNFWRVSGVINRIVIADMVQDSLLIFIEAQLGLHILFKWYSKFECFNFRRKCSRLPCSPSIFLIVRTLRVRGLGQICWPF